MLFLFPMVALAGAGDLCSQQGSKSFLSSWTEAGNTVEVLSTYDGGEYESEDGQLVYKGDLNGDGNDDFIFEVYASEGSSKERINEFLIQCKGYLVNVGGDYFSKVEVGSSIAGATFKSIKGYVYVKNKVNGQPLDMKSQESRVLNYNPATKKYE